METYLRWIKLIDTSGNNTVLSDGELKAKIMEKFLIDFVKAKTDLANYQVLVH